MSKINEDKIISILKECYDPEIPIDLWNLGLIYDIKTVSYTHLRAHET